MSNSSKKSYLTLFVEWVQSWGKEKDAPVKKVNGYRHPKSSDKK